MHKKFLPTCLMAVVIPLTAVTGCTASGEGEGGTQTREDCCWKSEASFAEVADVIGLPVPAAAGDRRAGYKQGERYDVGILTFLLPEKAAGEFLRKLIPSGTRMVPNANPDPNNPYTLGASFTHLGVPEPEVAKSVSMVSLCPEGQLNGVQDPPILRKLKHCVKVYEYRDSSVGVRIYVRAGLEGVQE
ncbi:hypothetical protein SRB5_25880 [Streptomyces sp. RB5]|uniref:Lipoprotein n=1 Tax=Streptomyces smaragdinus TaxID=2585196 RepID=A0A7K0CIA2_9ACTN|nr:hypothetical protein [Streptomyces smaragdinus]MQY12454.1 hypothetical protein [Streptomyces smaragdinus]